MTPQGAEEDTAADRPRKPGAAMARPYDPRDRYYRRAKERGLRARSAFKIEEILRRRRENFARLRDGLAGIPHLSILDARDPASLNSHYCLGGPRRSPRREAEPGGRGAGPAE